MSSSRRRQTRGKHARPAGEQPQPQPQQSRQPQDGRYQQPRQQVGGQDPRAYPYEQPNARQQVDPRDQAYARERQRRQQLQSQQRVVPGAERYPEQRTPTRQARRTTPYNQPRYETYQFSQPHYRTRKSHKVVFAVLGVLLVLIVGAGVAAAMYLNSLNSIMSLGDDADEMESALSDVKVTEPFYVLVLGTDSRASASEARQAGGQSDIILLVRVDTGTNTITLVSIPRDTPYTEDDGDIVKINHEYGEGPTASVKAVEDLTGVEISHFVDVSFQDMEDFVDYLGGIDVDVPIEITVKDPLTDEEITLEPGQQTLNGQQALAFARARHDYVNDQDVHRQKAVRQIVMAVMGKVRQQPISELPATVKEMASCVDTDLKAGELMNLARLLTDGEITVYSVSGPYAGDVDEYLDGEPWICFEDPGGWSQLMEMVDSGEDPSGISYVGDTVSYPGSDETFVLDEDSEMTPVGDEEEAEAEAEAEAQA